MTPDADQTRFLINFPREQGLFNTHVAYEPSFDGIVAIVPTSYFYGEYGAWGRDPRDVKYGMRDVSRFAYHNTAGNYCGRPRHSPRARRHPRPGRTHAGSVGSAVS